MVHTKLLSYVSLSAILVSCGSNETSQHLTGFSDYLEELGYSFYNPPRTDRGAGSVFRFVRLQSGRTGISPVCRNLFPDLQPTVAQITLTDERRRDEFSLDFTLDLLSDVLARKPDASADLLRDIKVEVLFDADVESHSYAEEDAINETGEPRKLSPTCYGRLKELLAIGELENNVFFIQDSVMVHKAEYSSVQKTAAGASVAVPVANIFLPKGNVAMVSASESKLVIDKPRYIAFKAMLIEEFLDTGLTSTGSATIRSKPIDAERFAKLE